MLTETILLRVNSCYKCLNFREKCNFPQHRRSDSFCNPFPLHQTTGANCCLVEQIKYMAKFPRLVMIPSSCQHQQPLFSHAETVHHVTDSD